MFYFKDDDQITVYFNDGNSGVWLKDSVNFEKVCELAKKEDWIQIEIMHKKAQLIMENDTKIENDKIIVTKADTKYEIDIDENDTLSQFIKLLKNKGTIESDIERIKPFLKNMFQNPYIDAVTEIYDFCKAMDFEITEDGCFLAYKNVNKDLTSIHDNKTKHTINQYVEVSQFNTDRNQTCSTGLHFCSKGYLSSYEGAVTLVLKIDPKDVVAIPTDYAFMKGRCKRYLPIGIMGKNGSLKTTNITAMTKNTVKVVKTKEQERIDKKVAKHQAPNRIVETHTLMEEHDNDAKKVSEIMNISIETVKRNMRKYRTMVKEGKI